MLGLDKAAARVVAIMATVALLALVVVTLSYCHQRKAAQEARGTAIIADGRTGAASDASAVRDRSEARNEAIDNTVSQGTQDVRQALTALLATLPLYGACASSPVLQMPAAGCSTLIPSSWAAPVPSAPLPADSAGEVEWVEFGIGQSGQLAKANGRTADVVEIVRSCETRDANSARRINAAWWQFWVR